MGRDQHRFTTFGVFPAAWAAIGHPHIISVVAGIAVGAWYGCTAPDWLELPMKPARVTDRRTGRQFWKRRSVIPHRTVTHWWVIWLVAGVAIWHGIHMSIIDWLPVQQRWRDGWHLATMAEAGSIGFLSGVACHLICDLPNPSGIPLLTPWHRVSLHGWRSGDQASNWVVAGLVAGSGLLVAASSAGLGEIFRAVL